LIHRVLGTAAGGGVLSILLATGWPGAVFLGVLVLVPVGGLCWVLADGDRADRLALLLSASRAPSKSRMRKVEAPAPPRPNVQQRIT
jgi:hypothetical protein